jgi:ubiquinone biosynthesis protein
MIDTVKKSRRSFAERFVEGPTGFRRRLERLGPTFIKIGQFLALRPDLIPQEYCDELMHLMDRVPPFPWKDASATLREELGGEPNEIFAHINPRPVAAGSLAQTHVARLDDGTEVAVKIQRPGIRAKILRDMVRAKRLARMLELSGTSLILSPREVVEEFSGWLMQEIDFKHELRNLTRLHELAAGSRFAKIPRPFPAFSTSRVLTAEYLRGIPVGELLLTLRDRRLNGDEQIDAPGIDRDLLARNLLWSSLVQIFRYQFFHADLHPGNLIALPGGVMGFVDFGLCDELDETVRERQMRYVAAFYSGDANRMFNAVTDIIVPGEETDMDAFRAEFMAETSTNLGRARAERPGYDDPLIERGRSPIADGMVGMLRAARRNKLHVPTRVLSMYKALLTAETVAHQLGTNVDLRSVGREFFSELRREEALRGVEPDNLEISFLSMVSLLRDSPSQLQQLLTELSEGRFELKVNVTEGLKARRIRNRRARLLVTSILSVCVALLLSVPEMPTVFGASLRWPLWTVLLLLYISIFILWRRLR